MKKYLGTIIAAVFLAATHQCTAQVNGPGTALLLNGTNGYATVTNASVFNFTGAFSVEAWIKVNAFTTNWQAIVTKGDSSWRLHRYDTSDVISFGMSGFVNTDLYGVTPVNDGNWHHIAGVYDGAGNKYLYVDGSLDAYINSYGLLETDSYPLDIGENAQQLGRVWDGGIDEVRIWNVARTQAQIQADMHRNLIGNETGLVAYYRLDEGSGTNFTNSVLLGSALDGYLTNSPAWTNSTAPIGVPVVSISPATEIANTLATLNASVLFNYQDTAYYFQYGTTTNCGTASQPVLYSADTDAGNSPLSVSLNLQGLTLATTYHYQLVASNSAGVSYSADASFTTGAHALSALTSFGTSTNGYGPGSGLVLSGYTLYGTTWYGGTKGYGNVFRINTDGTGFTNLYSFTGTTDGGNPNGLLVLSGQTLYGTTTGDDTFNPTIFAINVNGTGFTNLYTLSNNSSYDFPSGVIISGNMLYGETAYSGTNGLGSIFAINTNGTGFTNLYSFGADSSNTCNPYGGLVISGDRLYGTASDEDSTNDALGTVFAINTDGTGYTNLHYFSGPDGNDPTARLILAGGILYGTTPEGGTNGNGNIFAINSEGTGFTNLYNFSSFLNPYYDNNNDGANPGAGLLLTNNILYGTAQNGGALDDGTIFALNSNGTGFTNLYNFTGGNDGDSPYCTLVMSGNTLLGTAPGGVDGLGTVFALQLGVGALPVQLLMERVENALVLSWNDPAFSLQSAPTVNGTFTNVPGASSPYTNTMNAKAQFFRLTTNP